MDRAALLANINRATEALDAATAAGDHSAIARCTVELKAATTQLETFDALNPLTPVAAKVERTARHFSDAEGVSEWIERSIGKQWGTVEIERGDVFTGTGVYGALDIIVPDTDPVIDQRPRRELSFFSLGRSVPTESDTVKFYVETGFTSAAAPVKRRDGGNYGKYARSAINVVPKTANLAKIGTTIRTDEDTLSDRPGVAELLNIELPYAVREEVIRETLATTDTTNGLTSIAVTGPGRAQSLTYVLDPDPVKRALNLIIAIRKAKTLARKAGYPAEWVALSAEADEALELARTTDGVFYGGNPFVSQDVSTIWAISRTIVDSLSDGIDDEDDDQFGRVIVGQSRTWRWRPRTGVEVTSSANVDDDFERDAVVLKARQRVLVENRRPEGIVVITGVAPEPEDEEG